MAYLYLGLFAAFAASFIWLSRDIDSLVEQLPEAARRQLRLRFSE